MKSIARFLFVITVALVMAGCATRTPPPEIKTITKTEYVVIEVPTSYTQATAIPAPNNGGCVGVVDWKQCATSRALTNVQLYGAIGQCNADKYKTRSFLTEQTDKIKQRSSKP